MGSVRVDKYLWCVRLFKTRSLATQSTKTNKVLVNGEVIKPAKEVKVGDTIDVRKNNIWIKIEVLQLLKNRVGAKLVADYYKDITPQEELDKLEALRVRLVHSRSKGMGRPTKKERRDMEGFVDDWSHWDELENDE
jgi:ribosome-associated heat shock protein Hsp15